MEIEKPRVQQTHATTHSRRDGGGQCLKWPPKGATSGRSPFAQNLPLSVTIPNDSPLASRWWQKPWVVTCCHRLLRWAHRSAGFSLLLLHPFSCPSLPTLSVSLCLIPWVSPTLRRWSFHVRREALAVVINWGLRPTEAVAYCRHMGTHSLWSHHIVSFYFCARSMHCLCRNNK